ncbi:50S ribosomal protein L24 [Bdellovibrionota bacterium FG-1]
MQNTEHGKFTLRRNDQVQVIAGREKGKTGKILKVDAKNCRVLVEKVNMVKRHTKPSQQSPQGGIIEKELPLHYSNVLLMCPKCNHGRRHGMKLVEKAGKKGAAAKQMRVRICKKCGESLETTA